jgi:hypothetical protein
LQQNDFGFRISDCGLAETNLQSTIHNPQSDLFLAPRSSPLAPRSAFTLFELILAIALSATLMVLIGAAINLYLLQVDASRTRVEESQLARSILSTIAADIRAASVYQTQDTSAVSQLAASAAAFDVDEIDQSGTFTGGSPATAGGSSAAGTGGSTSDDAGMSSGGTATGGDESTLALAPGLNGTFQELILDVTRLPRLDELFPAVPQQPGAAFTAVSVARPSDVKTVRYLLRPGSAVAASDAATTSLVPAAQLQVGGLVRQTIDRAARDMAEQSGNTAVLESGQVLVAPEVVHVEFRYFDGVAAVDEWIMRERQAMPRAIEVRIWLADPNTAALSPSTSGTLAGPPDNAHMFSQTVELPLSQTTAASASGTQTDTTETDNSTTGGGDGSAFDSP